MIFPLLQRATEKDVKMKGSGREGGGMVFKRPNPSRRCRENDSTWAALLTRCFHVLSASNDRQGSLDTRWPGARCPYEIQDRTFQAGQLSKGLLVHDLNQAFYLDCGPRTTAGLQKPRIEEASPVASMTRVLPPLCGHQ